MPGDNARLYQVSNWGVKHIQELLDQGAPLPVVNQIDLHPFMRHPDIIEICEKNKIALEVSLSSFSHSYPALLQHTRGFSSSPRYRATTRRTESAAKEDGEG
jgi:diketogulonate reductase-like aldo/keto reductase